MKLVYTSLRSAKSVKNSEKCIFSQKLLHTSKDAKFLQSSRHNTLKAI
jgi:hypothetical protein